MNVASAYRRFAAGLLSFVVLAVASCGGGDAIANESLSRGGGMR